MPYRNSDFGLLSLLGLCPLLVKSTTLLTGFTMGVAALFVSSVSIISVSACRLYTPHKLKLPIILIVSVTWVTVLDLLMRAYWFEMRQVLGMYIPLLAMNSFVLFSLEHTALTNSPAAALKATLRWGVGIFVIVTLIGTLRELLGCGSLLSDAKALLGRDYGQWSFVDGGYSLLLKAPGAFLGLGLLLAAYKQIERKLAFCSE